MKLRGLLLFLGLTYGVISLVAAVKDGDDTKRIGFLAAGTFIAGSILVLSYYRDLAADEVNTKVEKVTRKHRNRLEDGQADIAESLQAALTQLRQLANDNEVGLEERYPFGYVLFSSDGHGFAHLPYHSHQSSDLRLELIVDWNAATLCREGQVKLGPGDYATLHLPYFSWWLVDSNGVTVFSRKDMKATYSLPLSKGMWRRHEDIPGEVNCYIEVVDPNPDRPSFIMGFRRQAKGEQVPNEAIPVVVKDWLGTSRERLDIISLETEARIKLDYPHGFFVFSLGLGGYGHGSLFSGPKDGLSVGLAGDWARPSLKISTDGERACLAVPFARWATFDEEEELVGDWSQMWIGIEIPRSLQETWFRMANLPHAINCYIELLDADAPIFVVGFRIQPKGEVQNEVRSKIVALGYRYDAVESNALFEEYRQAYFASDKVSDNSASVETIVRFPEHVHAGASDFTDSGPTEEAHQQSLETLEAYRFFTPYELEQLRHRYPYAHFVFTAHDGAFFFVEPEAEFIEGIKLVLVGNLQNALVHCLQDGSCISIFLPSVGWASLNSNGDSIGQQELTSIAAFLPLEGESKWIRPKDLAGQVNCYIELILKEKPVIVVGFRLQPNGERTSNDGMTEM